MDHPIFIALDFATADLARQFLKNLSTFNLSQL